jgi:hypothetical protein
LLLIVGLLDDRICRARPVDGNGLVVKWELRDDSIEVVPCVEGGVEEVNGRAGSLDWVRDIAKAGWNRRHDCLVYMGKPIFAKVNEVKKEVKTRWK